MSLVHLLQTEMSSTPVYVKCTGQLEELDFEALPCTQQYMGIGVVLFCKLKKKAHPDGKAHSPIVQLRLE